MTNHPNRRRLPENRRAIVHKFKIDGFKGYLRVGFFEDGTPGEVFIECMRGSTLGGLMDTIGELSSIALQHGVTIDYLAKKFTDQKFPPSGSTINPRIPVATSVVDYVFRFMNSKECR